MKQLSGALVLVVCLSLTIMSPPLALADRGMLPISNVSVYEPGQKAIIAWNGEKEILILSTDVWAEGDSQVLEILPLPSEPEIEKGDFASFEQVDKLLKAHFTEEKLFRKGLFAPAGRVEIVFHKKIGAHDITVVKAADSAELVRWAEEFLKDADIDQRISSPRLELLVGDYIAEGINFFVFDLIEVTSEPKSIEPIKYRFDTEFLYYPLKISTLASGWTDINLFLLTSEKLESSWLFERSELPQGMEIARFYGRRETQAVQFKITQEELASVDKDVASLLEGSAWLTALTYHGDLAHLDRDLKIYKASVNGELFFDYYSGRCASKHKSKATIQTLGDMILAYGVAITPTPCYELEAKLDIPRTFAYPPTIIVNVTAKAKPDVCIQCLGEVPFRAKIANLAPGQHYDVIIQYEDEIIGQKRIYLSLSEISDYVELPTDATLETVGTPVAGFTFQAGGKTLVPETVVRAKVQGSDYRIHIAYVKLDSGRNNAIVEVNNTPATIRLSKNCELKIIECQIFLDDGRWLLPVRVMPDEAAGKIEAEMKSIELQAVNGKAMYQVKSITYGRLLGLVPRQISIETKVDALSGEIIKQEQPWWARFCWIDKS